MTEVLENVSKKLNLPSWWVRAIALEYMDCREFADNNRIWTFNFDKISEDELEKKIKSKKIVVFRKIIHNVHESVYGSRHIDYWAGHGSVQLYENDDDLIPEGEISKYCFASYSAELSTANDPKLDFSTHFQVLDNGHLYQWRIAKKLNEKWYSSEIDLEPLNEIKKELRSLYPVKNPEDPDYLEYKDKVAKFYQKVGQLRNEILLKLENIHYEKLKNAKNFTKITFCEPPILSRFERFTVVDNKYCTKFYAEPVFYQVCLQHCIQAQNLEANINSDSCIVDKLDAIYQERAIAIIMSAACFEAFLNRLGFEKFPRYWAARRKEEVKDKCSLYYSLCKNNLNSNKEFNAENEPFKSLFKIFKIRNSLMHYNSLSYYKGEYQVAKIENGSAVTYTELDLSRELVGSIPNILADSIKEICAVSSILSPPWLNPDFF